MHFAKVIVPLAIAATASAVAIPEPAPVPAVEMTIEARNAWPSSPSCNGNQKAVCCNGVLGILPLACNVLGNNCNGGNAYCCNTNQEVKLMSKVFKTVLMRAGIDQHQSLELQLNSIRRG